MIVWAELDTSGDRMIGLAELEKLLPQSEASALMRSADVNKDGELTFSELAHQVNKCTCLQMHRARVNYKLFCG